jgi:hypothetical protein
MNENMRYPSVQLAISQQEDTHVESNFNKEVGECQARDIVRWDCLALDRNVAVVLTERAEQLTRFWVSE